MISSIRSSHFRTIVVSAWWRHLTQQDLKRMLRILESEFLRKTQEQFLFQTNNQDLKNNLKVFASIINWVYRLIQKA